MEYTKKKILGHKDIAITMKYYIDIDTNFIESENQNVVNYLVNQNIFEVNEENFKTVAV